MEKERPSHKQTSDETNFFCEVLADPVDNFMDTLERGALKKHSAVNYLIPLLLNLKKGWKMVSSKKKTKKRKKQRNQSGSQSRNISLKNLVIFSQEYNDNPFLKLTFCSCFFISFYYICLLFFVALGLLEVNN